MEEIQEWAQFERGRIRRTFPSMEKSIPHDDGPGERLGIFRDKNGRDGSCLVDYKIVRREDLHL